MNSLRNFKKNLHRFWRTLGPGLVTGASDDDPSAITTYSNAGAKFSLSALWTSILAYPLLASLQEMCARIGIVSNKTLPGIVKSYYSKWLLYLLFLLSCPAFLLNIGADFAGMGAVANLVFPSVPAIVFSSFFAALLIMAILLLPYRKIEQAMKLICLSLLVYVIVPFLIKLNWKTVFHNTFYPSVIISKDYMLTLTGLVGSILSPYVFFWQASMEVEETETPHKRPVPPKYAIMRMRVDILFGAFFAVLIMYFIMLTAGTVLHQNEINEINTVQDAAIALKPLAGNVSYLLFSIGVIGTGFLIIPVLATSISYMFAETFGWQKGLNKKITEAKKFYAVIIIAPVAGLGIHFFDISPVKALLYTTELYGFTTPVLIGIILHISNSEKIMGKRTNNRVSNLLGFAALLLTSLAVIGFFFS
jgi:NRAMP (natural resistance-associated macrophage protein)-like metal ion transporter